MNVKIIEFLGAYTRSPASCTTHYLSMTFLRWYHLLMNISVLELFVYVCLTEKIANSKPCFSFYYPRQCSGGDTTFLWVFFFLKWRSSLLTICDFFLHSLWSIIFAAFGKEGHVTELWRHKRGSMRSQEAHFSHRIVYMASWSFLTSIGEIYPVCPQAIFAVRATLFLSRML